MRYGLAENGESVNVHGTSAAEFARVRNLHHGLVASALALLAAPCTAFAPWGMEGVAVVSTRDTEIRATVSPDGRSIVWGSPDRTGGPGGWDLWRAQRIDGRWQHAEALRINTPADESGPMFSADGRWLYFASSRPGGLGGNDLYRVAIDVAGAPGEPRNLGAGVNTRGDELAPAPSRDGARLLFSSNGMPDAKRHDLFVAAWDGMEFASSTAVRGISTDADEFDGAWLADGDGLVFARSLDATTKPVRLHVATCRDGVYTDAKPLALAFNTEAARTLAPVLDWNRPVEMLVSGAAPSPKAGRIDIYRILTPKVRGDGSCGGSTVQRRPGVSKPR